MEPTQEIVSPHQSFITLGEKAQGTIEAGPEQQERLDEFTERLKTDEFFIGTYDKIPFVCIDGRTGATTIGPNSAGGTESLFVADDLTTQPIGQGLRTDEGYRKMLDYLQELGLPIGGHTDEHAQDPSSGCGANDKLPLVYDFIINNGASLKEMAASFGVEVSDATHDLLLGNAAARHQFSAGSELLGALKDAAPADHVARLRGQHKEVVAVINMRAGTTLDRDRLEAEFGPNYEAFNIDAWSFEEAGRRIASSEEEVPQKVAAMVYYNLATAFVLCGPGMRVIVRE